MRFPISLLTAGVLGLTALPAAAVEVEVGGQVNRALMYVEDGYARDNLGQGSKTETYFVDNRNSPTRFNLGVTQRLLDGWTGGAYIEIGAYSNSSLDVDPANKSTDGELDVRITDAFVDSPYGRITIGRGEGAAYNAARRDYSGTGVISFRHPALIGGSLRYKLEDSSFINSFDADGNFTGKERFDEERLRESRFNQVSILGSMRDFNFEGRHERIRYDSPRIGPVTLSASAGHGDGDGDARYNSILQFAVRSGFRAPGGRTIVGVGYSRAERKSEEIGEPFDSDSGVNPNVRIVGGSASYFHSDTGLNVTVAAVNRAADLTSEEAEGTFSSTRSELGKFRYLKLGYRPNRQHAFDIHYGETLDRNKDDEKATVVGMGYVYSPTEMFDIYAGAKVHSFERAEWCTSSGRTCYNPSYADITIVTTGIRAKF